MSQIAFAGEYGFPTGGAFVLKDSVRPSAGQTGFIVGVSCRSMSLSESTMGIVRPPLTLPVVGTVRALGKVSISVAFIGSLRSTYYVLDRRNRILIIIIRVISNHVSITYKYSDVQGTCF
jgi:hypothetical protein